MKGGVILLILTLICPYFKGSQSAKFIFENKCPYRVWPATLSGGGSPPLSSTGFALVRGQSVSLNIPPGWSGRVWARNHCSTDATGKFRCGTGDCGSGQVTCEGAGGKPPATIVEFTLANHKENTQDFYEISLVDGFNLPISVQPQGGSNNSCQSVACPVDVNANCPEELAVKSAKGTRIIGCKSACLKFNHPQFCCTGAYGSPGTCHPTTYSNYFKTSCPQAYSYAYDDRTSTFTCSGGADYLITFCP